MRRSDYWLVARRLMAHQDADSERQPGGNTDREGSRRQAGRMPPRRCRTGPLTVSQRPVCCLAVPPVPELSAWLNEALARWSQNHAAR